MSTPSETERAARLRLARSQNVGPATFHDLLARFGSAAEALDALPELARAGGARRPLAVVDADTVAREADAMRRMGASFVHFGTPEYPPALAQGEAPPPVLSVLGDVTLLARTAVAIVGSRQASAAGRTLARMLAEAIGQAGYAIVSGLARGIDGEAHRASLPSGTVAVLAGGIDRPTPAEHEELAAQIAERGALVSDMPLTTEPMGRLYIRRNRIIAGLCAATVVVEAARRSGSLATAEFAIAASRDVCAVPGSPLDPRAAGCLDLLRHGASLVCEADDVLAMLPPPSGPRQMALPGFAEEPRALPLEPASGTRERLAEALSLTPTSVDELVRATGSAAGDVIAALTELELAGVAEREPNGAVRLALPTAEQPAHS